MMAYWMRPFRRRIHLRQTDSAYLSNIDRLVLIHGREKAVELAVGGADAVGNRELIVLDEFGLRDWHYLIDVGCGPGRLTRRAARLPRLRYLRTDISALLIDCARETCGRDEFRFAVVDRLTIPERNGVADFVALFSGGMHLLNEDFFIYLEEARRVLRSGGRMVLSFLDLRCPGPRKVFQDMVTKAREGAPNTPINVFFTRGVVRAWASMLDLVCIDIINGDVPRWALSERMRILLKTTLKPEPLGQSVAILQKPNSAEAT